MQVMSKRGVGIAYVGGGSSVIAAGGYDAEGGNIALWDTMAPLSSGAIAHLNHHSPLVTALQVTQCSCLSLDVWMVNSASQYRKVLASELQGSESLTL